MADTTGKTVGEVAKILGITRDAVRKRIARGTLDAEKTEEGVWEVFLDGGETGTTEDQDAHYWELISQQQVEIERLQQELKQKDEWISQLIQRIPLQLPEPVRPWWRRVFGAQKKDKNRDM